MVTICPNCKATYRLQQTEERPRGFAKCPSCGHVFVAGDVTPNNLDLDETILPAIELMDVPDDADGMDDPGQFTALATAATNQSTGSTPTAVLVVASRDEIVPINKFKTTIGRRNADIVLDDPDVSRQHAVVERYDDKILLKDLESTNGTFLNGKKITVAFLKDGDVIRCGDSILRVQVA